MPRRGHQALGARVTLQQLTDDPHPVLAELREIEPVSWVPALGGWLVTRYDLAVAVMRDAETFTVEDSRFSTGRVIGPSMLSLDGDSHLRHRDAFTAPFRPRAVDHRFGAAAAFDAQRLIDALAPRGEAELRRGFAGPLATSIITRALGLGADEVVAVLGWYDAIVAAVTELTAGRELPVAGSQAVAQLQDRLAAVQDSSSLLAAARGSSLSAAEVLSNAAVLLFGGIETTEGMIANALYHVLANDLAHVGSDVQLLNAAIEESLRLEPAAAVVDRYATADCELGGACVARGELVRVSIAAANRDPAIFEDPNRFWPERRGARRHLAFAQGPHVCLGVHLARLEARLAISALLRGLSGLRLDPARPARIRGLVFRKPEELHAMWDV